VRAAFETVYQWTHVDNPLCESCGRSLWERLARYGVAIDKASIADLCRNGIGDLAEYARREWSGRALAQLTQNSWVHLRKTDV
jgi:hypothetical protein